MGMYTELIFGAKLKKNTPKEVIETLKFMMGELKEAPENYCFSEERHEYLFRCTSYYFGVSQASYRMYLDSTTQCYHLNTRSNIKNYKGEIETFLKWIKPYIESGSGEREMYAIVMYEEASEPDIYYLYDKANDDSIWNQKYNK